MPEGVSRTLLRGVGRRTTVDDLEHVAQVPVHVFVRVDEPYEWGRDAAPPDALDGDIDAGQLQVAHEIAQPCFLEPDVEQSGDGHVAADAGERIENQCAHVQGWATALRRLRNTASRPCTKRTAASGGPCSRPVSARRSG